MTRPFQPSWLLLSFLYTLLPTPPSAHASRLPFTAHSTYGPSRRLLNARANASTGVGTVAISNTHNAEYISNITLGGQPFAVMLDTGSSDLWVAGSESSVPGAKDLGKSETLSYAVGKAAGDIYTADFTFAGYTVEDQAFLLVTNTSSFSYDIESEGYQGLLGLGPNSGSVISEKIGKSTGASALNRIFTQNASSENYITFSLSRLNDPDGSVPGELTISEVIPSYANITTMPQLDVVKVPGLTDADQHWAMYTDVDGVIGPDGQSISVSSIVPKAPSGKLVAVLDSGFTLPQVPRAVADAIYGRVQGAVWDDTNLFWTVPCAQMLNVSFKFGGQTYPVHPLDTVSSDFDLPNSNGQPMCVGMFQPITSAFSLLGEYDMILGMAFLRNTYTLLDFGDFIQGGSDSADPYIQLLPVTDANAAHADFVKARMNGVDNTGLSKYWLLPASEGQTSPETEAEKKAAYYEKVLSRWPEILVGSLVGFFLLVGCCIWRCCKWRKNRKLRQANKNNVLPMSAVGGLKEDRYHPLGSESTVNLRPLHLQAGQHR